MSSGWISKVIGVALLGVGLAAPAAAAETPTPGEAVVGDTTVKVEAPAPEPEAEVPAPAVVTDKSLAFDVRSRIANDELLRRADVDVKSEDGVVTLAGSVPSATVQRQVVEAARATPGVRAVHDYTRIEVSSPSAPTRQ